MHRIICSQLHFGSYAYGLRFDLDFLTATNVDDPSQCLVFGIEIPVLSRRKSRFLNGTAISSDILISAMSHPSVKMILADFREAMRFATGTGFHCYRAIETMMQHMRGSRSEKEAWQLLRATLKVERSAIDYVKALPWLLAPFPAGPIRI